MNIGILGAGTVARKMAIALRGMREQGRDVCLYAVASRSMERARAFAEEWGAQRAYGSYEEMVSDPRVDLVYIATPHSHHAQHMALALSQGRSVLCEKAFTANARQAEEAIALARRKNVFLGEAMWTRFLPARRVIADLIAEGAIGEPRVMTAQLGHDNLHMERIVRPELAGGALLDLSVYTLNFASMFFGDDVARIDTQAQLTDLGVDHTESITLTYGDGKVAQLFATVLGALDCGASIGGSKGYLRIDRCNNPRRIEVYSNQRGTGPLRVVEAPIEFNGFEYQIEACMRALSAGKTEFEEMPHAQTLRMMRLMDDLRARWGVKYPFE